MRPGLRFPFSPSSESMQELPTQTPEWSLSVVSHGHMPGIIKLFRDLREHLPADRVEILLTLNIPEDSSEVEKIWPGKLTLIRNQERKGFGANHNAALRRAQGRFLAAIDPELRLSGNPFESVANELRRPKVGIVTTLVYDDDGSLADNGRTVVSPVSLLQRHLFGHRDLYPANLSAPVTVDWVAGLFMAMRAETFHELSGFDERYYLYCEDADLCLRSWNLGLEVRVVPAPVITHVAQRQTLKRIEHFAWHCTSLLKLWMSTAYRTFRARRRQR